MGFHPGPRLLALGRGPGVLQTSAPTKAGKWQGCQCRFTSRGHHVLSGKWVDKEVNRGVRKGRLGEERQLGVGRQKSRQLVGGKKKKKKEGQSCMPFQFFHMERTAPYCLKPHYFLLSAEREKNKRLGLMSLSLYGRAVPSCKLQSNASPICTLTGGAWHYMSAEVINITH